MSTVRFTIQDRNGLHEEEKQNPCLDILRRYMRVHDIYIDKRDFLGPNITVIFCVSELNWCWHYIANSREEILNSDPAALIKANELSGSGIIYGELFFSDEDTKMTAYLPKEGRSIRISTDLTVLKHVVQKFRLALRTPKLIWYYDPKP